MQPIHPVVRHLIVCDDLQYDPNNPRRITIVNLLHAIHSLDQPAFPLLHRELCVLAQVTAFWYSHHILPATSAVEGKAMTPQPSESVGCRMLGEFLDQPTSDRANGGGRRGASQAIGARIVDEFLDEFLDEAPGGEPPTR